MPEFLSSELLDVLPRLIFLGVILMAFGYAAGNARQLTGWKVGLLLIVVWLFLEQFNHGIGALLVMLGAFLVGYLLPQAHALEGFGRSLSEAINNLRYRNAYADIQRELDRAEALRREYEAMQKEQLREKAEAERARRRQHSRGGQQDDHASSGANSGSSDGASSSRRQSGNGSSNTSRRKSGGKRERSNSDGNRKSNAGRRSRSRGGNGNTGGYKRTTHQDSKSGSSGSNSGQNAGSQNSSTGSPALNVVRDKYLDEIGLTPGQDYSKAEIKKAFRRTAMKCHPDRHQGKPQAIIDQMTAQFQRVTTAYDWLYPRADD